MNENFRFVLLGVQVMTIIASLLFAVEWRSVIFNTTYSPLIF